MTPQDAKAWEELMGSSPFVTPEEGKEHYGQRVTPEEKQGLTDNALIHHGSGDKGCDHNFAINSPIIMADNGIVCPKCGKIAGYVAIGGGSGG